MKAKQVTVTIASGGTTSGAVRMDNYMLAGIITPSALTGTAFTFTVSNTFAGTYVPVYDANGNQVSVPAAVSRALGVSGAEADALAPWPFVKIVSNAAEGADRSVTLCFK